MFFDNPVIKFRNLKINVIVILWFILAILAVILEISRGEESINNYFIYKGVFSHTIAETPIYIEYPLEYDFTNHYGPFFSLIIAPFALLPNYLGCFLWVVVSAIILFYAIQKLPISKSQKNVILSIALVEMMTAAHNLQFNLMLTGWIVLSYVFVKENKLWLATFFVVAGLFVKLLGIVGIFFFLFSDKKIEYVFWFSFWLIVLFLLPTLISSLGFITNAYKDWYFTLLVKNAKNSNAVLSSFMQDISVMGMIRRIFNFSKLKNIYILIPAAIAYIIPLIRLKQIKYQNFQLQYLALCLLGVVLFSTSSESPSYILAMVGVGIWYSVQNTQKNVWINYVLVFAIIITSFSFTDLFPNYIKQHLIKPYSLKALPCFVVWLIIVFQLCTVEFKKKIELNEQV